MAVAVLLVSFSANAQETTPAKKKAAKTEKATASSKEDKKGCSTAGKKGCCAHKEEAK